MRPRFFNTAGPCNPEMHFMLPPLRRLPQVREIIDRQAYFVLHAARQVGKTTALLTLAQALTEEGRYAAVLLTMESGAPFPHDVDAAELTILNAWRRSARRWLPEDLQPPAWLEAPAGARIASALSAWARACPRPLCVFLDEIDALREEALSSVLRQIRGSYQDRPQTFPWALALCGMRDVRDYKITSGGSPHLSTSSPFNIKVESLTLRSFTAGEVVELYQQHTDDTGQVFLPEATERAFYLSQGQPWLVNALANQAVTAVADRAVPITAEDIEIAKEQLILRRDTHLDSLAERLRDPRVHRVIEPILIGAQLSMDVMNDDLLFTRDLGLIRDQPNVSISNPIYQEIIPRTLTYVMQSTMVQEAAWYMRPDGTLDLVLLLASFQEFFAENSEAWLERFDYKEAGPHLLLMAFLQRVVNGGGRIEREFAVGSGRADLVLQHGGRRFVIELKVRRGDETEAEGITQLSRYLDRLGEAEGFLVIFDRRIGQTWADKLFIHEAGGPGGQRIYVFGA